MEADSSPADEPVKHVTVPALLAAKQRRRLAMVTAYDATFAAMAELAGVDIILVGDSLGMVVQGHRSTVPVTVDDIVYHCRAVARRTKRVHLVADMPFLSCSVSLEQSLAAAARVMQQGGAHALKIEGGKAVAAVVQRLTEAGVPVMGHVGMQPQHVHAMGGFRAQGKSSSAAERIQSDARALVDAGVYALLIENVPSALAQTITQELPVPTIGIGAGPHCDGQVLVIYDLLGLTPPPLPRVAKSYDNFFQRGVEAIEQFCREVRAAEFP